MLRSRQARRGHRRVSPSPAAVARGDAGFSLVEILVALGISLLVIAGTMSAMNSAMRANESAKLVTGTNNNLRIAVDLITRDFIQVGQGLPTGRVVAVPSGGGAVPINRPGPAGAGLTFGAGTPVLSAVTVGPGLGPAVGGVATDIVTTLASDSAFDQVRLTALAPDGSSMTVDPGVNIADGLNADDISAGDLIMLTKGAMSTLVMATGTDGGQTVFFANGDGLNLNQKDPGLVMQGTINQLLAAAPADPAAPNLGPPVQFAPTRATRVRMISYYLDAVTDPANPRLVRRMGNDPARAVAFGVENLQISYDLVDGVTNPANVRMTAADFAGGGACLPNPCSENQIRKINVFLAGRSATRFSWSRQFFRNSLSTQISLRNLALVDRYR